MFKKLLLSLLCISSVYAESNTTMLHAHSIDISYTTPDGKVKKVTIARDSDLRCRQVPFNATKFWDGEYASADVPDFCKKTFITAAGKLSPMKMHDDIETFGELEVLEFMEEMQDDKQMLFVDSRKTPWYKSVTIPSAISIPFIYFTERDKWTKEKKETLKLFGVKGKKAEGKQKAPYDFSQAKTILFFCNGVWCRQSPQMIEALIALGYPAKKMKWYRGGMQSWLSVGMTSTRTAQ
ncbi:MAG: rhodanese-like domain-containing protein [Sulfurovum sp.]|nr:MAG: rhodanese-like domain-containing protein [Sulfurovum sp.]